MPQTAVIGKIKIRTDPLQYRDLKIQQSVQTINITVFKSARVVRRSGKQRMTSIPSEGHLLPQTAVLGKKKTRTDPLQYRDPKIQQSVQSIKNKVFKSARVGRWIGIAAHHHFSIEGYLSPQTAVLDKKKTRTDPLHYRDLKIQQSVQSIKDKASNERYTFKIP